MSRAALWQGKGRGMRWSGCGSAGWDPGAGRDCALNAGTGSWNALAHDEVGCGCALNAGATHAEIGAENWSRKRIEFD